MKIYKQFKEAGAKKFKSSVKNAVKYLEESGYYKVGTVQEIIDKKITVKLPTPYSIYYFIN